MFIFLDICTMGIKKMVLSICVFLFIGIISIIFIPSINQGTFHLLVDLSLDGSVPDIRYNEVDIDNDIILDTRSFEEYIISHIPNAIWIGENNDSLIPKNVNSEKVVLYCSIGKRSEVEGNRLMEKGNQNIFNLYGGVFEWHNRSKITINSLNDTTSEMHPYSWFWGLWIQKN